MSAFMFLLKQFLTIFLPYVRHTTR
jgi:hypothetical protein